MGRVRMKTVKKSSRKVIERHALAAGAEISAVEGVVEHGLFLNMATSVIIAAKSSVEVKTKAVLRLNGRRITRSARNALVPVESVLMENSNDSARMDAKVYRERMEPIVPVIFQRTKATCFAYGQTVISITHEEAGDMMKEDGGRIIN